jgi:tetratricopeptide (TPR) repeat protein
LTITPLPVEEETYNSHPEREQRRSLKPRRIVVLALLVVAGGCTSFSHPERAATQIAFGSKVAKKGLWREAAFRYEQAIEKEPNNARAHNNLAVALEANGDFARALAEYKKALELDANNNYIRRNYARFAEFYTSYTKTTGKAASAP